MKSGLKAYSPVVGFPRSGNVFLIYAISALTGKKIVDQKHTVRAIEYYNNIITPFRNPLDCISSWHFLQRKGNFDKDILYYLRFTEASLNAKEKTIFMNFDNFTQNVEYIKNKLEINCDLKITTNSIKETMFNANLEWNIPRDNKKELNEIKNKLIKVPEFNDCMNIYMEIKKIEDKTV